MSQIQSPPSILARLKNFKLDALWRVPAWSSELGNPKSRIGLPMWIAAMAIFMMRRFYEGIRHDGMFYAGQTMVRMGDANVAHDIFFRFGSQDQYTIFSLVNAFLVRSFGWVGASLGTVIVSQIAFLAGATLLLLEFAPLPLVALGIGMCAFTPFYGPFHIFSIGEPFLTARSLAEPLLVFAVVALFRRRHLLCVALMCVASITHPLLAAPVWCVLFGQAWFDYPTQRRWFYAAVVAVLAVIAAAVAFQPDFFLGIYDDQWWDIFIAHTPQLSMQTWDYDGWAIGLFDLAVLVLTARVAAPRERRFLQLMALALALSYLITAWGAQILRSVFLTEIQIWRAEDLAHLLAAGLFPYLLWRQRAFGIMTLLGALFILYAIEYDGYRTAPLGIVLGVALLALGNRVPKPTTSMKILVAVVSFGAIVASEWNQLDSSYFYNLRAENASFALLIHNLIAPWAMAAAFILGICMVAMRSRKLALLLSALMVILVAQVWDNRTPLQRAMEASLGQPMLAENIIPPGATVYWSDDLRLPWFLLDRESYYSRNQAAGLVFKRATAMIFNQREEEIAPLVTSMQSCEALKTLAGMDCRINQHSISDVCAPGGPDFLLLNAATERFTPVNQLKVPLAGGTTATWDIYDCSVIRKESAAEPDPEPAKGAKRS